MTASFLTHIPATTMMDGQPFNLLSSPKLLHRRVMGFFNHIGGESPRSAAGILFRVEPANGGVLVRSNIEPSAIHELSPVPRSNVYPEGAEVRFRIAVNAIHRTVSGGIRPVLRDDAPETSENTDVVRMSEWLEAKLSDALDDVTSLDHHRTVIGKKDGKALQLDYVDGVAVVKDTEKLAELLASGVGRAKNYGSGLLTVAVLR